MFFKEIKIAKITSYVERVQLEINVTHLYLSSCCLNDVGLNGYDDEEH